MRESALLRQQRAREIVRRLARAYPTGHPARPDTSLVGASVTDPLEELIFTLLSQHTSDLNRDRAWVSLRAKFPTWNAVAAAPERRIADAIRMGGLADSKAPRIKAVLQEIKRREGMHSLDSLAVLSDEAVREYLTTLPGVGPKTAACVLAFAMGRPVLPVDTHVHRLALRLGLVPSKASAEATQPALEALVAPRQRVPTHVRMIAHGRTTCTAQRPVCSACALASVCPSAGRAAGHR